MQAHQFIRYKTLDRCFRDESCMYTIDDLMEICTNAIRDYHADPDMKPVGRRTLEADFRNLKDYYGIQLRTDLRIGHKLAYRYVDTDYSLMKQLLDSGDLEKMLLQGVIDTLALYDDVPQYKWLHMFIQQRANGIKADQTKAIDFQYNPDLMGMEHFDQILNAIIKQQPLSMVYQKYHQEPKTYSIHPYLLKQFNDRWFLIAREDGFDNLSNFPLDRIVEISPLDIEYKSSNINFDEYYEDVVGVSRDDRKPVEDIILRITKSRYPYIETKPLHGSQKRVRSMDDPDHCVITLHVQVNNELEAKILSLGNDAEVISPQSFRNRIHEKVADLLKKYENK